MQRNNIARQKQLIQRNILHLLLVRPLIVGKGIGSKDIGTEATKYLGGDFADLARPNHPNRLSKEIEPDQSVEGKN